MLRRNVCFISILTGLLLFGAGCADDSANNNSGGSGGNGNDPGEGGSGGSGNESTGPDAQLKQEVIQTYADIVLQNYQDAFEKAQEMDTAIDSFIAAPSQALFEAAQQAWINARPSYLQTEVFRFYDGPIDNPADGPEGLLNAWPLDESYIDYVRGPDDTPDYSVGIINLRNQADDGFQYQTIDRDALLLAVENAGVDENVATGYHAIEFLLWGQDFDVDAPGNRSYTDYVEADGNAPNADRRKQYLSVASDLLLENLQQLIDAWSADGNNYRSEFLSDTDDSIQKILIGMIVLAGFETGGERLSGFLGADELDPAVRPGLREDEHSCFSDNTREDFIFDIVGIRNVWLGTYDALIDAEDIVGKGIKDLLEAADPQIAQAIDQHLSDALAASQALNPVFEKEFLEDVEGGATRLNALYSALRDSEESLLQEAVPALGYGEELELPEDPISGPE